MAAEELFRLQKAEFVERQRDISLGSLALRHDFCHRFRVDHQHQRSLGRMVKGDLRL